MVACLYTLVQNTSGSTHTFGYLGYHGVTLAAGATYNHRGNLVQKVSGVNHQREFTAMENDIAAGRLKILSTPACVVTDQNGLTKQVTLVTGALAVAAPCPAS